MSHAFFASGRSSKPVEREVDRRRRRSQFVVGLGSTIAVNGLTGCAGLVKQAASTAVPIVVSSGLGELGTPQSQAQLKSIAASPAVQEAGYGVGLGIGRGILDEGSAFLGGEASKGDEPPPAVGVAATSQGGNATPTANAPTTKPGTAVQAGGGAGTKPSGGKGDGGKPKGLASVEGTLTPFVGQLVRSAVTEGMGQATGPEGRAQIRATADAAGEGAVTGAARAVERDVAPAVTRMIRSALSEGLGGVSGPQGRGQLRAVAEEAGDGFVAGMSKAAERDAAPVVDRIVKGQVNPALDAAVDRLGPILHNVLQREVEPVVRDLVAECVRDTLKMPVRPENAPDVVANARNVSEGASLVTHDGLVGMGVLDASGHLSPRLRFGLWGGGLLVGLVCVLATVLLALRILVAASELRAGRRPQPAA